jgi:hypothetical protein
MSDITWIIDFDGVVGNTMIPVANFLEDTFYLSHKIALTQIYKTSLVNHPMRLSFIRNWFGSKFLKYLITKQNVGLYSADTIKNTKVLNAIKGLKGNKILLTSNYKDVCESILDEDAKIFDQIVGFDKVKSKTEAINNFIHNGLDIQKVVFITDTVGDIKEFKKLTKIDKIFGVAWGFNPQNLLESELPKKQVFTNYDEITCLNELFKI